MAERMKSYSVLRRLPDSPTASNWRRGLLGLVGLLIACNTLAQGPPPRMQVGVAGRCEEMALNGGGAEGCYLSTSLPIGLVGSRLYWHIDRFADVRSAEAARAAHSAVTVGLGGQVFLEPLSEEGNWRPNGGQRVGKVGPLHVKKGVELTAKLMEATTTSASATHPHAHSGPEGVFSA